MPRRREVPKRPVMPDPKYGDQDVTKFMNIVMRDGKKAVAEQIVYGAFDVIHERTREEPLAIFHRALENCQPMVEVKSRRVGGATWSRRGSQRPAHGAGDAVAGVVCRERPGLST